MTSNGLLTKYFYIAFVVALYWVISILTVFVNKALLSSNKVHLNAPLFVTWTQCIVSVVICCLLDQLSKCFPRYFTFPESQPFHRETIKKVLPLSILFTFMIASNNLCLKYVGVAFYYIGRSLTTVFNVIFTYLILGQKTSLQCIACCGVIVFGFWLGVDQESVAGSLSLSGTIYGVLASIAVCLYSIQTKQVLPHVNQEILLLSYYNNLYSLFLFLPMMLLNGEFTELYNYDNFADSFFWMALLTGGICGFAIGYVTALQIKVTSPLTHNISGTAKACAQTVLATFWYHDYKSLLWWFSNMVVLSGSAAYARAKQVELERNHNKPKDEVKLLRP